VGTNSRTIEGRRRGNDRRLVQEGGGGEGREISLVTHCLPCSREEGGKFSKSLDWNKQNFGSNSPFFPPMQ